MEIPKKQLMNIAILPTDFSLVAAKSIILPATWIRRINIFSLFLYLGPGCKSSFVTSNNAPLCSDCNLTIE